MIWIVSDRPAWPAQTSKIHFLDTTQKEFKIHTFLLASGTSPSVVCRSFVLTRVIERHTVYVREAVGSSEHPDACVQDTLAVVVCVYVGKIIIHMILQHKKRR